MGSLGVSVIIPTYNRASLVGRSVDSALAASRPGDEVLVVDDGSTDGTAAQLRSAYGEKIRYIASPHVGPAAIRNLGVREARLPLLAFLDSDDEWMRDKLELQRTVMERRPDVLLCFTDFAHRTRTGAEIRRYLRSWHHDPRSWDEILAPGFAYSTLGTLPPGRADFKVHIGDLHYTEMHGDYVCTSTVVIRRELAGDALHFPEDLRRFDDWCCFGRLCGRGAAAYLDCETQWNCDHSGPRVTGADDDLYCEDERILILQRVWGSDPAFLARHEARYREVLASHRRARAKELLALGRTREARDEFRLAGRASFVDRTLAAIPGPLTRAIVTVRRRLRGKKHWVGANPPAVGVPPAPS
jgi:glycosyltransferase involved in cell wall biosynthesis